MTDDYPPILQLGPDKARAGRTVHRHDDGVRLLAEGVDLPDRRLT